MTVMSMRRAGPGSVPVPPAYTAAAKAKLERDRKSFAAFRRVDQAEHDRAHRELVTSAVTKAEGNVRLQREDVAAWEPEAAEALAVFRASEDRARDAKEFARLKRVAYESLRGKCAPEAETEALVLADTADQVACDAAEVMAGRQAELTSADQSLAKAREILAGAERQLAAARKAAAVPAGEAPISDTTIAACAGYMQRDEIWNTLSRKDRGSVQFLGEPRNLMSDQEWNASMRAALALAGGVA